MERETLHSFRKEIIFIVVALSFISGFLLVSLQPNSVVSSELNVREYSPRGEEGGAVIPASCPSYAHVSGQCTPPTFSGSGGGGSGSNITINSGDSATLSWSCPTSYNTNSGGLNFSTGGALSGSQEVSPSATTNYSLSCSPSGTSADVRITVINPILSISANPTRVRAGNASTITWSASGVNSCTVVGTGISVNGTSGSRSTGALSNQSTYTLSCVTDGGAIAASVTVTLAPSFIEI